MTDRVLLDTDILSEILKGHNPVVASRATAYILDHHVFTFTSVTVYEIVYGLEVKAASSQLQKVRAWFRQNEEIEPSSADFLLAATTKATARRQGHIVELPDCLIASIAVRLNRPLVTGNTGDFRAIQMTGNGLRIENWR